MKKSISIVGGGTSALFLAAFLDSEKFDVTIFEKQKSLGRKFLVAGDGGFNLTHSESLEKLKSRYTPSGFLDNCLDQFSNSHLRDWLMSINIPTYIGSSKRVFPEKGIKPIQVLKAIESHLLSQQVDFKYSHTFTGWDNTRAIYFNETERIESDVIVFALGGSSWKVTGSDGQWQSLFDKKNISTNPFEASNCAFAISWDKDFIDAFEGQPLKNISISIDNKTQKGEVVFTRFGLEGNAIYALSPIIRQQLKANATARFTIDFKPTLDATSISNKLQQSKLNRSQTLKQVLKLTSAQVHLLKKITNKEDFLNDAILVNLIKKYPLNITGVAPIDEAISTAGGIDLNEINNFFELKKMKSTYCIGEMLAWDAPTGGYLIQACSSMGHFLANHLNEIEK